MSASPAQSGSGPNSGTPNNGAPPPMIRKKKPPVNIFNTGKKKPVKKLSAQQSGPSRNQAQAPIRARPVPTQQQPPKPATNGALNAAAPPAANPADYQDFPIVITKAALNAIGQRFHAFKFHSRVDDQGNPVIVNPFDDSQFVKPLRLHRRYARDKMEAAELSDGDGVDNKEREMLTARRAERQAEREENQKLIAPTGADSSWKPFKRKQQKKVEEGRDESNPKRLKRQKLRYEEARPWHLEDFEAKSVWVGSYEEALSERSIMIVPDETVFRMAPVERWYRFTETNKVKTMDPEEAEKLMQKKFGVARWGLNTQQANDEARREEFRERIMAARSAKREDNDDGDFNADRDMLDMEFKDEFQDDDEGMLFQGDEGEDDKEIEQKIWLEMRNAGLGGTGVKDEDIDPEEEERRNAEEEQKEKDQTKQLRKQLMKKEHQIQYGSDDEDFDSDDSEEEEEQRKKEEQEKEEAAKKAGQVNGDKSGSSTRGTNTPSGRPEKRPGSTLGKRPGSPDVSDLSGNESSRKRVKSTNGSAASSAPGRALSPDIAKKKIRAGGGGSGSGSDTDTSRGRPKIKLKNSPPGSPSANTPNGSRSGTPAGGSRAQSPKSAGGGKAFPTLEEVRAAIPPDGIEIKALVGQFKSQVAGRSSDFIVLVKAAGTQNKATGKIMPKS